MTVQEIIEKIEDLVADLRIKSYLEGFEEGRRYEQELSAGERDDNEMW